MTMKQHWILLVAGLPFLGGCALASPQQASHIAFPEPQHWSTGDLPDERTQDDERWEVPVPHPSIGEASIDETVARELPAEANERRTAILSKWADPLAPTLDPELVAAALYVRFVEARPWLRTTLQVVGVGWYALLWAMFSSG